MSELYGQPIFWIAWAALMAGGFAYCWCWDLQSEIQELKKLLAAQPNSTTSAVGKDSLPTQLNQQDREDL